MIIPFIWRILPGPLWLRVILAAALVVAVVWALFTWVFPAIAAVTTAGDPDVGA
jgi:hypothetical protein